MVQFYDDMMIKVKEVERSDDSRLRAAQILYTRQMELRSSKLIYEAVEKRLQAIS